MTGMTDTSATIYRDDGVHCGAEFSRDRVYRYSLTRSWVGGGFPTVAFIGLNPSTADETLDDPTVRRCMGFARSWGMGGMVMLNAFAFRATDPKVMKAARRPIGEYNDYWITHWVHNAHIVVPCWGVHGEHMSRQTHLRWLLGVYARPRVRVLGLTKGGCPKHPLYLSKTTSLEEWR